VTARINPLWLAVLMGDWATARELSDQALALQPSDVRNLASRSLVESQVGDFTRAEAYADELLKTRRLSTAAFPIEDAYVAGFLPLLAHVMGVHERLVQAEEAAEAARSVEIVVPLIDLFTRVGRSFIAILRSDAAEAEEQCEALGQLSGTALAVHCVTADRLLGLLARTAGRLEDALGHFERGLAFCERAAYRPEYAWTACAYAEALLERAGPGDRERAAGLRAEALDVARDLGMRPLADRVNAG
jgi:tetratricopeptide (TPR) repeat protein